MRKIVILIVGSLLLLTVLGMPFLVVRQGPYRFGMDVKITKNGFLIGKVKTGSSADTAGLQAGQLLVRIGGRDTRALYTLSENSMEEFLEVIGELFPRYENITVEDSAGNVYDLSHRKGQVFGNLAALDTSYLFNIIIGIVLVCSGLYFFLKGERSRHLTLFVLFTLSAGAAVSLSYFYVFWNATLLVIRFILLDLFGLSAGLCLFLFAVSFPSILIRRPAPFIAGAVLLFIIKYALILFFGISHSAGMSYFVLIFIGLSIFASIVVMIFQYGRSAAGDKRRMCWFFTGAVGSVLPYLVYIVFVLSIKQFVQLNSLSAGLNLAASFSLIFFPLSIGVGLVHHTLVDIDWLLKRLFSITLLGCFYAAVVIAGTLIFRRNAFQAGFISVILSAAIIGPFLYKKIQLLGNRIFFIRQQQAQERLIALEESLVNSRSTYEIYQKVCNGLQSVYAPEYLRFILLKDGGVPENEYLWEHPLGTGADELDPPQTSSYTGGVLVPIIIAGGRRMFLDLGRRLDKDAYMKRDISLLKGLAVQIAQALANSRLYEELQIRLREKDHLLKEIHHRVKNNMQLMSSMLHLQAGNSENPEVLKIIEESSNRIDSMALIHETLYQSENFAEIEMEDYINSIVTNLQHVYALPGSRIALAVSARNVRLSIGNAIPCGLIVNELVSNAFKHAFPGDAAGTISISLEQNDEYYTLEVSDNGAAMKEKIDLSNPATLGMTLTVVLIQQLGGTLDFRQTGREKTFSCRFRHGDKGTPG